MVNNDSGSKQTIPNCCFYEELMICLSELADKSGAFYLIQVLDSSKLKLEIGNCLNGKYKNDVLFYGYDHGEMVKDFYSNFKLIRAAGGVVKNKEGQYLFIKRHGIWDLPKGKIEYGESDQSAAIREVVEETGISEPIIRGKLPTSFHIYRTKKQLVLKETTWYLMDVNTTGSLKPQLDEDITEAVWLSKDEARNALAQSYRSLRESLGNVFID